MWFLIIKINFNSFDKDSRCGPGFFILAANELIWTIKSFGVEVLVYADDVLLIVKGTKIEVIAKKANLALHKANE